MAQQSVIDHCKQTSTDADRVACLEAALLGKEVSAEPEVAPEVTTVEEAAIAVEEAAPEASAAEVVPAAVPEAQPEGIGAEQVLKRTRSIEEREANMQQERGLQIAKYEWVPYERLVVTFENGQVWRQIKGDVNRIRTSLERNQTADIVESGLGGYQLRLNEIRRTIRVERIR
jgi:hypothetical protein